MAKQNPIDNNEWQFIFKFKHPYNLTQSDYTMRSDSSVNQLLAITDGDLDALDDWITTQLTEIADELTECSKQLEIDFSSHDTLEHQREMFDRLFTE